MNRPVPTSRARTAYGFDENGGNPICIKAMRRGRSVSFSPATPAEAASPAPRTVLAACLYHRESFTRWLTAPIASPRKAESVFHSLLDVQLPFSVEDCEVALLASRPTPDGTGTQGLVAGARHEDIERKLASLATAGLDPHVLDQESIALWQQGLIDTPVRGDKTARIVVYLGADRVTVVAGQAGEFIGAHSMRQSDAESIQRFLKSQFPETPSATLWLWTGPGATTDAVAGLQAILVGRWPGTTRIVSEPETFLARALAARALSNGRAGCNLRTGRLMHPDLARRQERQPLLQAGACLAAGLLLCAVNIAWLAAIQHRIGTTQAQLPRLAAAVTGTSNGLKPGQEAIVARRAMEQQVKEMEPFLAAVDHPLRDTLAATLAQAGAEGLGIEMLTLSRKNGVIHGLAPHLEQATRLSQRLGGAGWTATIERKETPPGEERVAFVIGMERTREKK